jgi:hypothetical protein
MNVNVDVAQTMVPLFGTAATKPTGKGTHALLVGSMTTASSQSGDSDDHRSQDLSGACEIFARSRGVGM